jgi:hypothetical protein
MWGIVYEANTISRPQGEIDLALDKARRLTGYIELTVLSTSKVICRPHVCDESITIAL